MVEIFMVPYDDWSQQACWEEYFIFTEDKFGIVDEFNFVE